MEIKIVNNTFLSFIDPNNITLIKVCRTKRNKNKKKEYVKYTYNGILNGKEFNILSIELPKSNKTIESSLSGFIIFTKLLLFTNKYNQLTAHEKMQFGVIDCKYEINLYELYAPVN